MIYDPKFFESIREGSQRSAAVVVQRLNAVLMPSRVIDIGCGEGWWLRQFEERRVRVLGMDNHEYDSRMAIARDRYFRVDLSKPLPIDLLPASHEYDLALSLEVAEHIPADMAEEFVAQLCAFAPVVCFSAAIPGQGGDGHVNEQWPSYWANIFAKLRYVAINWPRSEFWYDDRVELWYRQNMMLFALGPRIADIEAAVWNVRTPLDVVHPRMHKEICDDIHHDYQIGRRKVGEWKRQPMKRSGANERGESNHNLDGHHGRPRRLHQAHARFGGR
jgi:SAM-dependent methyltransferase